MNKTLFITMTLSIIAVAVTCFLLLQFWKSYQTQKTLDASRPKGRVGFAEAEPIPAS